MNASDTQIARAQVAGRQAAEKGEVHHSNPYPYSEFKPHLAWFNAWLVRKIEIEDNCKLTAPDENPNEGVENS